MSSLCRDYYDSVGNKCYIGEKQIAIECTECVHNPFLNTKKDSVREYNVGTSDYSNHKIQPWDIWEEYKLNPWEADIVKRILRTKKTSGKSKIRSRIEDLEKIIHVSKELIRQLELKLKGI